MKQIMYILLLVMSLQVSAQDSSFYFKTSDHVNLYVRVAGKGKPCVFVHGGPGSSSYYYEAVKSASIIEQSVRMIYFDQRGSGRSDSASDYSLARMELDLEELRRHLGYERWAVMGHSFGGIIITRYAADYPASVSSLLLINCTLNLAYALSSHIENGLNLLGITDRAPYRDSTKNIFERLGMVHEQLHAKGIWYQLMYRNQSEKTYNDTLGSYLPRHNRDFAEKVWAISDYWADGIPYTQQINCPVMIMTGDKDYAIGPDHYRHFRFSHATVVHYAGGHAPFQEEPQWYAQQIITYLSSLPY